MEQQEKNRVTADAAILFCAVSLVYFIFVSRYYNFDGIACAIAVELGKPRNLFHSNHLFYGYICFLFDRFLRLLGYTGLTINSLQILTIAFSASAVSVFYVILRRISGMRLLSLIFSLFCAFSFGYWFWSTEAQVYPISFTPLLLIFYLGITRKITKYFYAVILLHIWAICGHVSHVVFTPVIFYFLSVESDKGKAFLIKLYARYAVYLFSGLLILYGVVIIAAIKPANMTALYQWLMGSAALTADHSFQWHGTFNLFNFATLAKTQYSLFLPFSYNYIYGYIPSKIYSAILAAASNIVLAWLLVKSVRLSFPGLTGESSSVGRQSLDTPVKPEYDDKNRIKTFGNDKKVTYKEICISSLIWLVCYFLFFSTWEPTTLVYSLTNAFPLWIIIFLGVISAVPATLRINITYASLLTVFAAANLFCAILPLSDPAKNTRLNKALLAEKYTPPDSIIIVSTEIDKIYVPYFTGRYPFYFEWLEKNETASISALAFAIKNKKRIFVFKETIDSHAQNDILLRNFHAKETGTTELVELNAIQN